jgi:succinoglycan biosynthesis transport protein ExoP
MQDMIELRWCFQVIRRWWWLIVGCVLLLGSGTFAITCWTPPVYSASATLLVSVAPAAGVNDYTAIRASELLVSTYSQMLKGRPVMKAVIERLDLHETPGALARRVEVDLVKDTQLMRLTVSHTDPAQAALIANTIAETFITQMQAMQTERHADSLAGIEAQMVELSALIEQTQAKIEALSTLGMAQAEAELTHQETLLAGYRTTYATLQQNYEQMRLTMVQSWYNVIVVEPAEVSRSPIQHRTLYTVLAAAVGAMLALGIAFLLEYLDDTTKTADDVNQTLGLGTLGTIGRLAKGEEELAVAAQPFSPVTEAFRVLCANIRFSSVDKPLRTLLVTSPNPAEGKSVVVANLAIAMAEAGLRAVIVDADLRRPRLHELFGLDPHNEGLTGALLEGNADGRLQPAQMERLAVLTSGELPPNPAEMLGSRRMQELLAGLAQQADMVLVDGPPVLPVADAATLAQGMDGVLLVLEAGRTRREAARRAVERLHQVGANPVGVVLNAAPTQNGTHYNYSYYETHRRENERRKRRSRRRKEPLAVRQAQAAQRPVKPESDLAHLGRTGIGGAFILAALLAETGWLNLAHLLPQAAEHEVTSTQWLLTAILAVIFETRRTFRLDNVNDIGFGLLTGRRQPLAHDTFYDLLCAIPAEDTGRFYQASVQLEVQASGEGTRRISLGVHNLPRWSRIVDPVKGPIDDTGRTFKTEEPVLAFDLDALLWVGLRVDHGTRKVSEDLEEIVRELLEHRGSSKGLLRLFFDKGNYGGQILRALAEEPRVRFYMPAVRYPSSVARWEQLQDSDFDIAPFTFANYEGLPVEQRPAYRLADTKMTLNAWEKDRLAGTATLRAVVLHDPQGEKPAERWPVVLLTDDDEIDARALLNEYDDHWGYEAAHRKRKHDLYLDILPPGYALETRQDGQGQLEQKSEFEQAAFLLSAWLHCLALNLMSRFGQALGGDYTQMGAGTLLREFVHRPATLDLVGQELHVTFAPWPGQEEIQPLLDRLNARQTALPWLNNVVVRFSIAQDEPIQPPTALAKWDQLFGNG